MDEIILNAEIRQEIGRAKAKDVRESGFIPAIVYSGGGAAQAIKLPHKEFLSFVHQHRAEGIVISLKIKDDKKNKSRPCLIKEMQYNPVHGEIVHVDFIEISLTEAIKVNVPVVAKGEPVGVKQEGGSLEHILWEIEIECLPMDIPKGIEVDVSNLKMGESIHIKDITFPPKIKVLTEPSAIVLSVAAPMKEEVPAEPVEGAESQEPEVIKEKKVTPEEAAEAAAKEPKEKEKEKEKK